MSCCQNPTNLGCFDSCQKVTIEGLTGGPYATEELYITYNFNGAIKRLLITDVDADGKPILDLSKFNEDYFYTFEVYKLIDDASLGCFKMKVLPCAGDFFSPAEPEVTNFLNSAIIFGAAACSGETLVEFVVDIVDVQMPALIDGTIINFAFTCSAPGSTIEVVSEDANLEVLSETSVRIIDASAITSIALKVKISNCDTNAITAIVTSFTNLADTWGNGTHTGDSKTVN